MNNDILLSTLTLEQLAQMYNEIEKRKDLYQGLILLEARARFPADIGFGKWRSGNLPDLKQEHANRLMNEARYFQDKPDALEHIGKSVRYSISAPVNKEIADELYEKCMKMTKVTGKAYQALVDSYNPKYKEPVKQTHKPEEAETMNKAGLKNFILDNAPDIEEKQLQKGSPIREMINAGFGGEVPPFIDTQSDDAEKLLKAIQAANDSEKARKVSASLTVEGIFNKLTPEEQKVLHKEMSDAKKEYKAEVSADNLDNALTRAELKKAREAMHDPFTRYEFKTILGMLHPDKHPDNEDKARRAFNLFKRIEFICKKKERKVA